jgi:hypothetical protein
MGKEVDDLIRNIGRNIAFETGIRVGLSLTARLLLGYLGGLPATAISVNAAVAFFLSAVFELPLGMAADIFSRTVSMRLGYFCQCLASLSIFCAVLIFPIWPIGMWILITAEGVLDALGNSLLSGAREAAYQSFIEGRLGATPPDEQARIRKGYLSSAEAHGRAVLVFFPLFVIGAVLVLNAHGGHGHFAMLIIAAGWLAIDRQFRGWSKREPRASGAKPTLTAWREEFLGSIRLLRQRGRELWPPVACWMVNRFVYITVTCYFALAVIKDRTLWRSANPALPALVFSVFLLGGRLARSFILPAMAKTRANESIVLTGAALQSVLAGALLIFPLRGGPIFVIFAAAVGGVFDVLAGLVERPALGLILIAVPERVRASFLSLISAVVLLLQFAYSVRLTALGTGVPSMWEIWSLVLGGSLVMSLACLDWQAIPRRMALAK